jgi:hypothetical protein
MNDLLPLPYTREALRVAETHIAEVQDALGRPYLIENPSSYVSFRMSTMTEAEFLSELVRQTGCGILCDISNAYLSSRNLDYDAREYIDSLPSESIQQLHLGGYTAEQDEADPQRELLIDTHAAPIAAASWDLYRYAIDRFGPRPTLVEWDNDIPPLGTLLGEAVRAGRTALEVMEAGRAVTR